MSIRCAPPASKHTASVHTNAELASWRAGILRKIASAVAVRDMIIKYHKSGVNWVCSWCICSKGQDSNGSYFAVVGRSVTACWIKLCIGSIFLLPPPFNFNLLNGGLS